MELMTVCRLDLRRPIPSAETAIHGFLLLALPSILVQVPVAKWRHDKKKAEERHAAAEAQRGKPR